MFGRKRKQDRKQDEGQGAADRVAASATVVAVAYVEDVEEFGMALFDFTLDVALADAAPFRATSRQQALTDQVPKVGDTLTVAVDPAGHEVVLDFESDPRYRRQSNEEAQAFNHRCATNLDEVMALETSGKKSTALVTEVTECGWLRSLGQREFAVVADVTPTEGDPFTTSFSIFDTTDGLYTPSVGQVIAVVYDDADPPMVRAGTFWDKPQLELMDVETGPVRAVMRWRVPSECPNCGAPVDQSTESQAAHPRCHTCDTPLPCEPA